MIRIVAGCNERYRARFEPCRQSLAQHSQVIAHRVSVGFVESGWLPLSREQNHGAPPETECIQHGSFLRVAPGQPDDVIVYLDGDVTMQRPLDAGELAWLESLPAGAVSAAWNRTGETLIEEARALGPRESDDGLRVLWGAWIDTAPALNAGIVAARRETWEAAYAGYMDRWDLACASFGHQARQQWLMCWTWQHLGLDVQIMSWQLHAHGHFGLKPGMEVRPDGVHANGKLAVFRHHC